VPPVPPEEDCDTARTRVVPRLDIDKIDDRDPVNVGGNILYTLRVTNEGSTTVPEGDIVVIDELPIGDVRLVSVDSNKFECDPLDPPTGRIRCTSRETLSPDETASIKITVDPDDEGTIENTATVGVDRFVIDEDTETTRVEGGGTTDGTTDGTSDGATHGTTDGTTDGTTTGTTGTTGTTTGTTDGNPVDGQQGDIIDEIVTEELPNTGGSAIATRGIVLIGLLLGIVIMAMLLVKARRGRT
jgi:hypothetical protein